MDLNAFLSLLASEATIPSPDTDRMCLSANLDLPREQVPAGSL